MQTKLIAALSGSALAAAALTALVLRSAPAADVDTAVATVAQAQPAGDAPGAVKQGIAVKGHWQIEVRNPDGTVAERREFDNSLTVQAIDTLRHLMSGVSKHKAWAVAVGSTAANPCEFGGNTLPCFITEWLRGGSPDPESSVQSNNLTVTVAPYGLQLRGSKVVSRDGTIDAVMTKQDLCNWSDNSPRETCTSTNSFADFTLHMLASGTEIQVVAGQQVLVTVLLTFSSAT